MTTSGTTSSTLVASDVVRMALLEIGAIASGQTPTGEELEDGLLCLNWLMKSWQSRGVTSWRDADGSVTFPLGVGAMVLSPFCLDVLEARLIQSPGYERPLQRWTLGQYRQIPNKAARGSPTSYTISKTAAAITMTVWPVPSAALTVNYSYTRIVQDVTDGAQTLDVPQEWLEAVYLGLASRLITVFGTVRIDPATASLVAQKAAALEQALLDQDRSPSVYMGSAYGRYF